MRPEPLESWEGEPVERLREWWGVPELRVFHRAGSTNDLAREMAEEGGAPGSVVIAAEQTAGRGRRGRQWAAAPGTSLLLSMVLRPPSLGADPVLSLRLGIAAARAIEEVAPTRVCVKWPNDLLVDGRKTAGILCEGAVEAGRPLYVIAGIGINVSQSDDDWPPELRGIATSLAAATRRPAPTLPALAHSLVARWLALAAEEARALSDAEVREFQRRDILRGRRLAVDGAPAGTAAGVAPDGALLVRKDARVRRVVSGTVRPLDEPEGVRR